MIGHRSQSGFCVRVSILHRFYKTRISIYSKQLIYTMSSKFVVNNAQSNIPLVGSIIEISLFKPDVIRRDEIRKLRDIVHGRLYG